MEDLELQLLNLLQNNWTTSDKDTILFHRHMRRVEGSLNQPNIIVCESTETDNADKEGMLECLAIVIVRTRIPSAGTTLTDLEAAKEKKHQYREEVYRILSEMDKGTITKPTGWRWAHVSRRLNGDNFDAPTPMLGEDIHVKICYTRE